MIAGKRICVVMPAYNAEKTLEQTVAEIPRDVVDDIVLVDDGSHDATVDVARRLGLHVIVHPKNRGYGGNQKTCYTEALKRGADIVVMVHPDYQYTPLLIPALASCVASGLFDAALGSRILGGGARGGGMPVYKYVANRLLTLTQNLLMRQKLSEYHTGYRAFSRRLLTTLPPGKARFTIIDPVGLGQNFAGFMHLADYDETLVTGKAWSEPMQIENTNDHAVR